MPTRPLPSDPSLVQLRKQARELQRRLRSGDPQALKLLTEHFPDGSRDDFPLHVAQVVIARLYGFAGWPALVHQLKVVQDFSRTPEVDLPDADPVARFLAHAVLRYADDDGPARWAVARDLLAADPTIGAADAYTASVTADHHTVRRLLAADAAAANRQGGPLEWEPMLYLAYARLDPHVSEAAVLATARLLLDAGADPNAGFLWHGLPPAFTVLTGVLGSGEQGVDRHPHHPHALALARLLLESGADPNDGQALYNRMFQPDNHHLDVLFEFGLGDGDDGPWRLRMPEATEKPDVMVRGQLRWAISHGMAERITLLASHGMDLASPLGAWFREQPVTPVALALRSGQPQIARLLVQLGAPAIDVDPETQLVGALLAGNSDLLADVGTADLLAAVRREHPALILRAAVAGSRAGIDLLLANGFDVNALGRQDLPIDQEWETALHYAAGEGDLELARTLLMAGADPDIVDRRFRSTPLGWAENFDQQEMVELLRPVTQGFSA